MFELSLIGDVISDRAGISVKIFAGRVVGLVNAVYRIETTCVVKRGETREIIRGDAVVLRIQFSAVWRLLS